jgi:two-component system sensor histidine kinase DegS
MRNRISHFVFITILVLLVITLYYLGDIRAIWPSGIVSTGFLQSQAYHELCLLLSAPALIYAAVIFRIRGAVAVTFAISAAIMPHALLFSPYPDPLFRELSFTAISLLLGVFIGNLLNNKERLAREQTKLERYTSETLEVQEKERQHLARELHDDTAQQLVDISHAIDKVIEGLDGGRTNATTELKQLRTDVEGVLESTRRVIQGLRPPLLEELGLEASLQWLAEETAEEAGIAINVNVKGEKVRFPGIIELTLFRIAQETLTNAKRYSQANNIEFNLEYLQDKVRLIVVDDGVGFDPVEHERLEKEGKFGLIGITERAHLVGGKAQVKSAPGKGTTISVELPLSRDEVP